MALALVFWVVAWAWIGICGSDSADVGPGFYVFLCVVYLVFSWMARKIPFLPKARWLRFLAVVCYGGLITGVWILAGIAIARWIKFE